MRTADEKLKEIERVVSAWLEPDSAFTSYQAMAEIMATLEEFPATPEERTAHRAFAEDAERKRWEQDRPDARQPRDIDDEPTVALRLPGFLG